MSQENAATRRQFLGALGALPTFGASAQASATPPAADSLDAAAGAALVSRADRLEYVRLRKLDLTAPETVARQQQMPAGRIKDLRLGRLIGGSNLIGTNMHARDLKYVNALSRNYNTEDRVLMTMKLSEEYGSNAIILKHTNFRQLRLSRYWDEWGGKMRWIADVITTDIDRYEKLLAEHLELGAAAAYLWGGASDIWYHQGKQDNIIRAFEIMKAYDIPVGICAHRLEPIAFCVKQGLTPDFYMLTLHHDRYWSAHPKEKRRFSEMYEPDSPHHDEYHDNMFCHEHERTIEFMRDVPVPWIAFKVMAAGAIPAQEGIRFAFENGADFVCLGMFDWQVREDVELVKQAVAATQNRPRRWF
ncbi:MAG: hypothetical protein FJ280_07560 [Planctomycetes bacterium]|nr:hypothetical protein [Planctomycetota bacterium]